MGGNCLQSCGSQISSFKDSNQEIFLVAKLLFQVVSAQATCICTLSGSQEKSLAFSIDSHVRKTLSTTIDSSFWLTTISEGISGICSLLLRVCFILSHMKSFSDPTAYRHDGLGLFFKSQCHFLPYDCYEPLSQGFLLVQLVFFLTVEALYPCKLCITQAKFFLSQRKSKKEESFIEISKEQML